MCLFKYREKKYGKYTLLLVGLILIVLALASIFGGVVAVTKMQHWAKYIIVSVASVFALALIVFGVLFVILSLAMTGRSKSVRDINTAKGIADTRLCDYCGRVISKRAEFCEHCGKKQHSGLGMRTCPECKTKNSANAKFCENCGHEFED